MKLNSDIQRLLIIAYSNGKESGHHETVEGVFWGDGQSESHDTDASEWLMSAMTDGTLDRKISL